MKLIRVFTFSLIIFLSFSISAQSPEPKDFRYALIVNSELNADSVVNHIVYWHTYNVDFAELSELVMKEPEKWRSFKNTKVAMDYFYEQGYDLVMNRQTDHTSTPSKYKQGSLILHWIFDMGE